MRKLNLLNTQTLTFEEGCNLYLLNCKQRNLREGTINHYKQSYTQFYRFIDPAMPLDEFDETLYKQYILHLRNTLHNDISINSYLRDMITTMHFLMDEGYVAPFKMQAIKTDKSAIQTYTDEELRQLLQKPNIRKCTFTEYQCWVMTNFLLSTAIRQRSLMHIKIADVDLENQIINVKVTKNRKPSRKPLRSRILCQDSKETSDA